MNENVKKMIELKNDEAFGKKVKEALSSYTGEKTEEAVFTNVVAPLAKEQGVVVSFEDLKAYADSLGDQNLDVDELKQVAGGDKTKEGIRPDYDPCKVIGWE